jgi:hypothetical protein
MQKLTLSREKVGRLQELKRIFAKSIVNEKELRDTFGGSCGAPCMVTCSTPCHSSCGDSCVDSCSYVNLIWPPQP